ncbi:hypothetical protein MMC08_004627 [Hypocenomyce scalaris]|nr:hypothetical protein [Hypocenomyce scalaris]
MSISSDMSGHKNRSDVSTVSPVSPAVLASDLLSRHNSLSHVPSAQDRPPANTASNTPKRARIAGRHEIEVETDLTARLIPSLPSVLPSMEGRVEQQQLTPTSINSLHTTTSPHITSGAFQNVANPTSLGDILTFDSFPMQPVNDQQAPQLPEEPQINYVNAFDPLDDFSSFLESAGLPTQFYYSSMFRTEQPLSTFSSGFQFDLPTSAQAQNHQDDAIQSVEGEVAIPSEEVATFSRFGSRLPSLQPEVSQESRPVPAPQRPRKQQSFWNVSTEDRQHLCSNVDKFRGVLPAGFVVPSRHALSRYLAGFVSGFHEHLPFLHIPTLSTQTSPPDLILAIAAVGSHYCFESTTGVEIFKAAMIIALEHIR